MSVLVLADIRDEVRSRVGDDDSNNYLVSDSTLNRLVTQAYTSLYTYYIRDDAEQTVAGTGALEYTLPTGTNQNNVSKVYIRSGTDITTDLWVNFYKIFNGKIRMPFVVATGQNIVIQYRVPKTIASDMDSLEAEILYMLLEIAWIDYAISKRVDFEQWATISRSDSSIGSLMQAKRDRSSTMEDKVKEFTTQLKVIDVWGGA